MGSPQKTTSGSAATGVSLVSVVIPAYNEETRLSATLDSIWNYLHDNHYVFEIIVVDDGSTDQSVSVAEDFAKSHSNVRVIRYAPNRGKGFAVRTGILEAQGDYILFSDADLATPIDELKSLMKEILAGQDIAIASRAVHGSRLVVRQPWYREFAGRSFNLVVQALAVPGIHDTQCGFKLFKRIPAKAVFARCVEDGFAFDIEALFIARKLGYVIVEVPVHWMHRDESKVRLFRDATRMLIAILRIRKGNYQRTGVTP